MSRIYSVNVILDEKNNEYNIKRLLNKGLQLEFIYSDNFENRSFNKLNIDEAANAILFPSDELLSYGGPFLITKFQDTDFFLWIRQTECINISIGGFGNRWDKNFYISKRDITNIDYARYIRLILQLCEGFTILKLNTETQE